MTILWQVQTPMQGKRSETESPKSYKQIFSESAEDRTTVAFYLSNGQFKFRLLEHQDLTELSTPALVHIQSCGKKNTFLNKVVGCSKHNTSDHVRHLAAGIN